MDSGAPGCAVAGAPSRLPQEDSERDAMDNLIKQARSCSKWRERMGFTKLEACRQLGLSRPAWDGYENGTQPMPLYIALACEALEKRAKGKG